MRKPRPQYIDRIRALKVGKSVYLLGAKMGSIKAIACRTGKQLKREFTNSKDATGVWVERNK
jgi:hypothetical protein